MALITYEQARDHLRLTADQPIETVEDVMLKMEQASEIVLDRINTSEQGRATSADWDETTVPRAVQASILLVLTHLYEHRGDDPSTDEAFWAAIHRLLSPHRDPVIA